MSTSEIIKEIERLPMSEKMKVVEHTLKSIKKTDSNAQMKLAANKLIEEYKNNTELTAFKEIDFEDFYEAK